MRAILAFLLCATVAVALTAGCASRRTYSTPGGKVTVEEKSGKTEITVKGEKGEGKVEIRGTASSGTIATEKGKVTFESGGAISAQEFGLPFYPGAKVSQTAAWSQEGKEEGKLQQVTLTTSDSVDQVKAFYQQQFPQAQAAVDMTAGDQRMVQLLLEKGNTQKMVMISRQKEAKETTILLHRGRTGK